MNRSNYANVPNTCTATVWLKYEGIKISDMRRGTDETFPHYFIVILKLRITRKKHVSLLMVVVSCP